MYLISQRPLFLNRVLQSLPGLVDPGLCSLQLLLALVPFFNHFLEHRVLEQELVTRLVQVTIEGCNMALLKETSAQLCPATLNSSTNSYLFGTKSAKVTRDQILGNSSIADL